MEIEDIEEYLEPDEETIGSISIRKPTAGTLSLCDFAQLKIASGGATSVPFYEAIAFFFIHSRPLEEVRDLLFDISQGRDENGCSLKFINTVLAWGDEVDLGNVSDMGETIGRLLTKALTPKVEPSEEKKAEDEVSELIADIKDKKK